MAQRHVTEIRAKLAALDPSAEAELLQTQQQLQEAQAAVVESGERGFDRIAHGALRRQSQSVARFPRGVDRRLQVGRHEIPQGAGKLSSQSARSLT